MSRSASLLLAEAGQAFGSHRGAEAIELASRKEFHPAIVIADYNLPGWGTTCGTGAIIVERGPIGRQRRAAEGRHRPPRRVRWP